MAKKSQRRFDARRFHGNISPDNTSALSEGTVEIPCLNTTTYEVWFILSGDSMWQHFKGQNSSK